MVALMEIIGIDHLMLTIPLDAEVEGRRFYEDVLGLAEIPKPTSLQGRGGFWLRLGNCTLHIGTEDGMERYKTKAHIAFIVVGLTQWQEKLEKAGIVPLPSIPIPGYNRFEIRDPFGNRLEFIEPSDPSVLDKVAFVD